MTTAGTLATRKLTPVDTTSANLTEKLPTGAAEGTPIAIEKLDATTHEVTVEGSIRGSATSIKLRLLHETVYLIADSTGSWWVVSSHKTLSSLESVFFLKASGETIESRFEAGLLKDANLPADATVSKVKALGALTGATAELNLNEGTTFTGTLEHNVVFTVTNAPSGRPVTVKLLLKENGTGGFTWSVTSLVWANSTPTFTTAANARVGTLIEVTPSAGEIIGLAGPEGKEGKEGKEGAAGGSTFGTAYTEREWNASSGAEVEPSATNFTFVSLILKEKTSEKTGVEAIVGTARVVKGEFKGSVGEETNAGSFIVPPGKKYKVNIGSTAIVEKVIAHELK